MADADFPRLIEFAFPLKQARQRTRRPIFTTQEIDLAKHGPTGHSGQESPAHDKSTTRSLRPGSARSRGPTRNAGRARVAEQYERFFNGLVSAR